VARDTVSLRIQKAVLLSVCLVPAASLVGRAFGIAGSTLGANPIEALLHGFGKWGLNFLLVTLAVTPVRQLARWPHLLRFRRLFGLTAFFYVAMHFLIWLGLDQGFYLAGVGEDIARRPYITIGFLALLLLIPLAVTSTDRMMRRLGRRWTKLHRLIYPIAILGVWHYYWQVKLDVREPLIYGAVLSVLLGWRAWEALRRRRTRPVRPEPRRASQESQVPG
jgi:sulfoxide reductase heme-binding subunit YedZ